MGLRDEIHLDPKAKGYMALLPESPGTVADMLNAQTETMVKAIRTTTGQAWAAGGPYAAIVDASNTVGHPCRASCLVLRESFSSGVDIHMERADVQSMFAGWVTGGLITTAQRDDLFAKATQPASRMEVLGLPPATILDVIGAM